MKTLNKLEAIVASVSFALIFVTGFAGHLAVNAGMDPAKADVAVKCTILLLFFLFGFATMGLFLHLFVVLQGGIGNQDQGMVKFLREHEAGATYAMCAFFGAGTLIALPFALQDLVGIQFRLPVGKSRGVLVADIGLMLDEIQRRSTLKIAQPQTIFTGAQNSIGTPVFDFQIANSTLRFPQSRLYFLETGTHDPHLISAHIEISPRKMPADELQSFQHRVQQELKDDGWMPGHCLPTTGNGRYWRKGNTLVLLEVAKVDDEGNSILNLILEDPRNKIFDGLVFEPLAWTGRE